MTIFSKIIAGDIPCYKVAEDDEFFAFLDINPLSPGHTLVIPKQEVDYYFDLPSDVLGRMTIFSQRIAKAIDKVVDCQRVGIIVLGLEVPHAHVHLVPIRTEKDMSFAKSREKLSKEEMKNIASSIQEKFIETT